MGQILICAYTICQHGQILISCSILCRSLFWLNYAYYYYHLLLFKFFTPALLLLLLLLFTPCVFHSNFNWWFFTKISSILAVFNSAVIWRITVLLIFSSNSFFSRPLGTIPRAQTTIGITIIFNASYFIGQIPVCAICQHGWILVSGTIPNRLPSPPIYTYSCIQCLLKEMTLAFSNHCLPDVCQSMGKLKVMSKVTSPNNSGN